MDPSNSPATSLTNGDFPHYRRVWRRVVAALLAAAFVPLLVVGGGMYGYACRQLEQKTRAALEAAVVGHQETIDRFLAERVEDLELLAGALGRGRLARQEVLDAVFAQFHRRRPWFQDLGVIDADGRHLAYHGPYDLIACNYRQSAWFAPTLQTGRFISDVYSGFRREPHFIIAIRRHDTAGDWILRATVEANAFEKLVGTFPGDGGQDAYLVNTEGRLQSLPRRGGRLMTPAALPQPERFEGVHFHQTGRRLLAQVWLAEVPWLCVVEMSRSRAFSELTRVRRIGIAVLLLSAILIGLTVLWTTNSLVSGLETARHSIQLLDRQLRRTSYLASTMELADGLLHELGDVFDNIALANRWLSETSGAEAADAVDQIGREGARGRSALERFLRFTAAQDPLIVDVDLHRVLDDLVGILERDLRLRGIRVERDYRLSDPTVRSDRGKLRQVFQNLVLNAVDAIGQDGTLTLATAADGGEVRITVADTGPGVPPALRERIFTPLFTTKDKGTGLGLAICRNLMTRIGGRIELDPWRRQGAAFGVVLPVDRRHEPAPDPAHGPGA